MEKIRQTGRFQDEIKLFGDWLSPARPKEIKITCQPSFFRKHKGNECFGALREAGTAPRFPKPQDGGLSIGSGGTAGLPPLLAETFWVSALKTRIPAAVFTNRAAAPAPSLSFPLKENIKREGRQD
jgi:hypothetical protein